MEMSTFTTIGEETARVDCDSWTGTLTSCVKIPSDWIRAAHFRALANVSMAPRNHSNFKQLKMYRRLT